MYKLFTNKRACIQDRLNNWVTTFSDLYVADLLGAGKELHLDDAKVCQFPSFHES